MIMVAILKPAIVAEVSPLDNRGSGGDSGGKPQHRGEGGVAQVLQTVDVWGGT